MIAGFRHSWAAQFSQETLAYHTWTHTDRAVVHHKHTVKLIGLTWQQSQWCQSNPSLKPWWHHHTGESVWELRPHAYGEVRRVCVYVCTICVCVCVCERDTLPVSAKGALAAVQVIQVKLFLKTHTGNTTVTVAILIILCSHMQFIKYTSPHSHKQL